jgi:hypothetical protein
VPIGYCRVFPAAGNPNVYDVYARNDPARRFVFRITAKDGWIYRYNYQDGSNVAHPANNPAATYVRVNNQWVSSQANARAAEANMDRLKALVAQQQALTAAAGGRGATTVGGPNLPPAVPLTPPASSGSSHPEAAAQARAIGNAMHNAANQRAIAEQLRPACASSYRGC